QLAVGVNTESRRDTRLNPSWQSSRACLSRELAGKLSWNLTRNLSRNLSRDLAWHERRTKLSRYLSRELRIRAALGSRLRSGRTQCDWRQTSRLIRGTHGRQRNWRKTARLSHLARRSQCDRRKR